MVQWRFAGCFCWSTYRTTHTRHLETAAVHCKWAHGWRGPRGFLFSVHLDAVAMFLKCWTGWAAMAWLNFDFVAVVVQALSLASCLVHGTCWKKKKRLYHESDLQKHSESRRSSSGRYSARLQGWGILGEMENLLLQEPKPPTRNFYTQWLLFETKCYEHKGQTNSVCAGKDTWNIAHNWAFNQ